MGKPIDFQTISSRLSSSKGFCSTSALLQAYARSVAVVMSHNYLQDQALLAKLLAVPLAYLGVLGPHARTQRLLADLARGGIEPDDELRARLFGPVGLDIGAETAEAIALSILGEIQAVLTGRQGGKLRDHAGPIHDRHQ